MRAYKGQVIKIRSPQRFLIYRHELSNGRGFFNGIRKSKKESAADELDGAFLWRIRPLSVYPLLWLLDEGEGVDVKCRTDREILDVNVERVYSSGSDSG